MRKLRNDNENPNLALIANIIILENGGTMLTEKQITRSLEMDQFLGRRGGACFGVTDPSRLRPSPSFLPLPPATKKNKATVTIRVYTLQWFKNKELQVASFRAKNNGLAVIKAMRILGIKGKLTGRNLRKAGAEKVSIHSFLGSGEILSRSKR
jgi:hypothetical protein